MSAREIIKLIEALPEKEMREVIDFVWEKSRTENKSSESKPQAMSFDEAKNHVFTTYRDVLQELAK